MEYPATAALASKTAEGQDDGSHPWRDALMYGALPAALAAGGVYAARRAQRPAVLGYGVQRAIQEHGLHRVGDHPAAAPASHPGLVDQAKGYYLYGTPHTYRISQRSGNSRLLSAIDHAEGKGGLVFDPGGYRPLEPHENPVLHGHTFGGLDPDAKHTEALLWNKIAPGFMPDSHLMPAEPNQPGMADHVGHGATRIRDFAASKGIDSFIVKGLRDSQTGPSLITDQNMAQKVERAKEIHRAGGFVDHTGKRRSVDDIRKLQRGEHPDVNAFPVALRVGDANGFAHLDSAARGEPLLIQKRLPIIGDREMRLHVLNGRVIPGATVYRNSQGVGGVRQTLGVMGQLAGVSPAEHTAAEAWAQAHLDKMKPEHRATYARQLALDVAPLHGGGFTAVETNPASPSGFLDPVSGKSSLLGVLPHAISNHNLVSALQGKDTRLLAATRAAGAGLAAGATGLATSALADRIHKGLSTDETDDSGNSAAGAQGTTGLRAR